MIRSSWRPGNATPRARPPKREKNIIERRRDSLFIAIESIFVCVILSSAAYCLYVVVRNGYLPFPFYYFAEGTFMDWFDTAYWANIGGQYANWGTVYPPLSFVIAKILSISSCYNTDSLLGRRCDYIGLATIITTYLLCVAAAHIAFRARVRRGSILRTLAFMCGFPVLYSLNSGNLNLQAMLFLALAFGCLLKMKWGRWIAVGLSINLKPYLSSIMLPFLVRREWGAVERVAITTLIIYLMSFFIVGAGTPGEIIWNQFNWTMNNGRQLFASVETSSSYFPLIRYLNESFAVRQQIGSAGAFAITSFLGTLLVLSQAGAFGALGWAAINRYSGQKYQLEILTLCLLISTIDLGVYTEMFVIFLVFLQPASDKAARIAIVAAYLLCISSDVILINFGGRVRLSYLTNRVVEIPVGLTIGAFLRPGLLLIIQNVMTYSTLIGIARGVRRSRQRGPSAPPPGFSFGTL